MLRDVHACRAHETRSYQHSRHPCSYPTSEPWNNACGGLCTIRSGMRHEDDLVCSPGLRFQEGGNVIAATLDAARCEVRLGNLNAVVGWVTLSCS